jgi:putative acetyltransferase
MSTGSAVTIKQQTNWSPEAQQMLDELWREIQSRYHFQSPNMIRFEDFTGQRSAFWLALNHEKPIGSIALKPLTDESCELDAMYVIPSYRGKHVAADLMTTAENFMRMHGFETVKLRTGEPQPEAIKFYLKTGFKPIASFGKWKDDPTARCFEKRLTN